MTIALVNGMTSLRASITVFSVLGFQAASDHGRCRDEGARCPRALGRGGPELGPLVGIPRMTFCFPRAVGWGVQPEPGM